MSVSRGELWPPNHALVDVGLRVELGVCRSRAGVVLAAYSDEPENGTGDGDTAPDAKLDPPDLYLRRERQGGGDGRVYLLLATASHDGASAADCGAVVVPKSQSKPDRDAVQAQANAALAQCRAGSVPSGFRLLVEGELIRGNEPPKVDAGPDQGIELGAVAHLDGSVGDDGLPDGVLKILWSKVDGPGDVSFVDREAEDTDASFSLSGRYRLRLTATDGDLSASDEMEVVVQATNAAPIVSAGPDQSVTLPNQTVNLPGSVTDDGQLLPTPLLSWSVVSGPGTVAFSQPMSAVTEATFTGVGVYELRLTAYDGQFSVNDEVGVTVSSEPAPVIDIENAAVTEGSEGLSGGTLDVRLSKQWMRPVAVEYVTADATATAPCDYRLRFGSLHFAPGETQKTVLVPVVGDQAVEGDEEVRVLIGNPVEATLGRDQATLTVEDDDGPNQPPAAPSGRMPLDGTTGLTAPPTLAWSASDPDPGDAVTHDVYLGATFGTAGQEWLGACPAGATPGPRWGALSAYDEATDRLMIFGGETPSGATDSTLHVLVGASATAGSPRWLSLATSGGPVGVQHAAGGYDPATNRLIVFGGCRGDCQAALADTWVLESANGIGGAPEWIRLQAVGPSPRLGHAAAFDPAGNRLFVFGGAGPGGALADVWVLDHANGVGQPEWRLLPAGGDTPAPRRDASLVYDPRSSRLILFGGRDDAGQALGDVFVLSGIDPASAPATWHALSPASPGPGARFGHAAAFDAASRRLLVYGGSNSGLEDGTNYVFGDLWLLTEANGVAGDPTWVHVATGTTTPRPRFAPAFAYAVGANRLVLAAGANNKLGPPDDVWVLGDAVGRLPLVAAGLLEPRYLATEASAGATSYWRVVTRDPHGAWRGSPAWTFSWSPPVNQAPLVNAGPDQTVSLPNDTVLLHGTVSDDGLPAGGSVTQSWTQVSGPGQVVFGSPTSAETSVTFPQPGTYVLRLTASDTELGGNDEVTVLVLPQNQPPLVDAGADVVLQLPAGIAFLSASASDDGQPPGSTLSASWSRVSGPGPVVFDDASSLVTAARFTAPGLYLLRITVSDSALGATDDLQVLVHPLNQPPLVNAGPDRAITLPTAEVTLAGSVGDDGLPLGAPVTTTWSVVSGPGPVTFGDASAPTTAATFTSSGVYVLRLNASDTALDSSDDVAVTVASPSNLPDLTVVTVDTSALTVDPQTLAVSGTVAAEIKNAGVGPAAGPFAIFFFEDLDGDGAYSAASDSLLAVASEVGLGSDASATVTASVSGSVTFAGNLIHAFVDAEQVVLESNEANNYGGSAAACDFQPWSSDWNVTVKWAWTTPSTLPDFHRVLMAPVVIDLDGDGVSDVVVVSHANFFANGVLRALRGSDGSELFTVQDPAHRVNNPSQIAAGDIDGDGRPEIVAVAEFGGSLIAFEHDGTFKWRTVPPESSGWGGPNIADLDGDGTPEIIMGRQVFNSNGTLRWTGTGGRGDNGRGPQSIVVDLDGDGHPEVVGGNTAYYGSGPQQGQIRWRNTTVVAGVAVQDGFAGAANFDDDANPEIVLISGDIAWLLDGLTGAVQWGPVALPSSFGFGGHPTVADFDADGRPEIAVAGGNLFTMLETDGTIKWTAPSQDSSTTTGAAAFDFDGDGAAEVVYADESSTLRIFRGRDGLILFQTAWASATAAEGPVIADVDGDGKAELVAVNDGFQGLVQAGVYVFEDTADHWAPVRAVWNQYDYHVTNVNDDGTIPRSDRGVWGGVNSHRQAVAARVQGGVTTPACAYAKPDLTASLLRISASGANRELTVRIGNGGALVAPALVAVSFYDGDPEEGASRLGTAFTAGLLPPGRYEDVVLTLPTSRSTARSVWIVADDFGGLVGAVTESDETNNRYDSGVALGREGAPDLTVESVDDAGVTGDWQTLVISGTVSARIRNQGGSTAGGPFLVSFFDDLDGNGALTAGTDTVLGVAEHADLPPYVSATVTAPVSGPILFRGRPIHAFVDSGSVVAETDEANNVDASGADCNSHAGGAYTLALERSWTGSPTLPTNTNVGSTPVVIDLNGDGVSDVVFVTFATTADNGHLRAISGRTGTELFTVTDSAFNLHPLPHVAAGDIDQDGKPEILGISQQNQVIAFEHDGTFKWRSLPLDVVVQGGPTLADLDGDGSPEILAGRQVLRADGTALWKATQPSLGQTGASGASATVADLDLDGRPEVVLGNTAYRFDGSIYWTKPALPDGITAVANFDNDPYPEIVLVDGGLRLLEHDGQVRWGPLRPPGFGFLGAPVVADFDGDGRPEIGVGMKNLFSLVESSGFVRWSVPTSQPSGLNQGPAASAFDFDGDGKAEVVLTDANGLRILRGRDGATLATSPLGTCTQGQSYPLAADADGDGNAEIVTAANLLCGTTTTNGVFVLGEAGDRWVTARPIWNQHTYHVTNVNDDGTIPADETPSWLASNGFRLNAAGAGSPFASPDATASYVRRAEQADDLVFTVRVGNAGASVAPAGLPVSFYNGHPARGFPKLGTVATTRRLGRGEHEDVSFAISSQTEAQETVHAAADDGGGLQGIAGECDDENNVVDSGMYLNRRPEVHAGPDQTLAPGALTSALAGQVTDDGLPLGRSLTFFWAEIGDPSNPLVQFDDSNSLTTGVRFAGPGTYLLRLTATDSVLTALDHVVITVPRANQAPIVDAGHDQVVALPAHGVALGGLVSDDGLPAGNAVSSSWSVVSGPGTVIFGDPASPVTTALLEAVGQYVLRLSASDGALSASDDVVVNLDPFNQAPVVSAGPDRAVPSSTTMAGSVSDDGLPRGQSLTLSWSVVTGPGSVTFADPASPTTGVVFGADGAYQLRLTANDGVLSASDDVLLTVNPPNQAPAVSAGPDVTITLPPTSTVALAGSVTDDGLPFGAGLSSLWTQVSGPAPVAFAQPASPSTSATFSTAGVYVLSLTASDTVFTSGDGVVVTVLTGNRPPTVTAGPDQTVTLPTDTVTLAGSASDDGLPAGSTLAVSWTKVSGPGAVVFGTPTAPTTTATFTAAGNHVLRLTATDGELSSSADVRVTLQAAPPVGGPPVVEIASPEEGAKVPGPTDVVGSVASASLFRWALEYRRDGELGFSPLASGQEPVSGGVLGRLDPTLLLNGAYELRLVATDNGNRSTSTSRFVVVRDNQKVGHFSVSFVDLEVPVAGLPIRVTRTYDSRDKGRGDFGFGWRLELSDVRVGENGAQGLPWFGTHFGLFSPYCVVPIKPSVVTVSLPDGRVLEFEPVLTPQCQSFIPMDEAEVTYRARPGTIGSLAALDGSQVAVVASWPGPVQLFNLSNFRLFDPALYKLTLPDGREFVIEQGKGLKSITDLNGNRLTVTPGGITHSSGKGVVFKRDLQGRIEKIIDPAENSMGYGYDANGDLESFKDRENNTTTFTYHPGFPHHLASIKDPLDRTPITNEYYDDGRLKAHTDAFGKRIEYTHNLNTREEVILDREGRQRVLGYDERGNVVQETDPKGKVIGRSFDDRNNRLTETVPHDPTDTNPPTTVYTYYPGTDNLHTLTDAEGNLTEYTYNSRNQVTIVKDARGHFTVNDYEPAKGNLLSTEVRATLNGPALSRTTYTYWPDGNLKTQRVWTDIAANKFCETSYEYFPTGELKKETDPFGHATDYTYDANGNRLTQTTTRILPDSTVETLTTTYVYDKLGRLQKTIDPDQSFTETVYDEAGRPRETYDKLRNKTTYRYDDMGRLELTTFPDGSTEESTYYPEGARKTHKDRNAHTTSYTYDPLGRLETTTYPDTAVVTNHYDAAGRLEEVVDARGKLTRYEYHRNGQRKAVSVQVDTEGQGQPVFARTEFTYDPNGNQATVKDPRGQVTRYDYDEHNRRTLTTYPPARDGEGPTFSETSYDAAGRRSAERDQEGKLTQFHYDCLGRLTDVVDAAGKTTGYGYDEVGNRTSQTDADLHTTRFEYDKLGRLTKRTLPATGNPPLSKSESFTHWPSGQVKTRVDFVGRTTRYEYEALSPERLRERQYPDGSTVGFTYWPAGQRRTATDPRGLTSYTYDSRNRPETMTYPDGRKLKFGYDKNSNRETLEATIGATTLTTTYRYDDANRLFRVIDPLERVYEHGYDANSNRASLHHPNGVQAVYTYDNLNRLRTLDTTRPASGLTVQSYIFELYPSGARKTITEHDGTVREYGYDAIYRLTSEKVAETIGLVYQKSFTYDDVGNRQTQTTTLGPAGSPGGPLTAGTITYGYDERDRLSLEGAQTHTWDDNGNLVTKDAEATYTWDFETRLIQVTKVDGTVVEHAYDPDGNRVHTKTTKYGQPSETTNFLVDTSASLSHVVAETDGAGNLKAFYVRGDDLLAVMRPTGPTAWHTRFYHADGLGSIRRLTDEVGNITDGYTYSAFGEVLAHTGSDPQPYAFAGEPYDPNGGFQYHRARWMDPRVGRFTSIDPWAGTPFEPGTLHRYVYVRNNAVSRVDPSGLAEFSEGVVHDAVSTYINVDYRAQFPNNIVLPYSKMSYAVPTILTPDLVDLGTPAAGQQSLFQSGRYWLEVKPLSLSGLIRAENDWAKYALFLGPWGYLPRVTYQPSNPVMFLGSEPIFIANIGGIVFYTDRAELYREALLITAITSVWQLRAKLAVGVGAASRLNEFARIARLAAIPGTANVSRMQSQVGTALMLTAMAGFAF